MTDDAARAAAKKYAPVGFGIAMLIIVLVKFGSGALLNPFGGAFADNVPSQQMFALQVMPPIPTGVVGPTLKVMMENFKEAGTQIESWEKQQDGTYILKVKRRDPMTDIEHEVRLQFALNGPQLVLAAMSWNGELLSGMDISTFLLGMY